MLFRTSEELSKLLRAGAGAWSLLGILLLAFLIVRVLIFLRVVIPVILVALILVYLLAPAAVWLERRGLSRGLALAVIYLSIIGLVALAVTLLVPVLAGQIALLIDQAPRYGETIAVAADGIEGWFSDRGVNLELSDLAERNGLGGNLVAQGQRLGRILTGTLTLLLTFVAGPILAFYVLLDLPRLQKGVRRLIPDAKRERAELIARDVNLSVSRFVRGQLIVAAVVGLLSTVALMVLRVPGAVALGLFSGLTNLIPFVGPIAGGIVAGIVAWATRGGAVAVWVLLAFFIIQQIESHVLSPNVVGRVVRMNPATVMVAIIVGAIIAGVWGMLFAVPVVAGVKAAAMRIWFPDLIVENEAQESRTSSSRRR